MGKYIYKITNKLTNKIYIGQSNNPKRRFKEHCNVKNAERDNSLIGKDIEKYGKENFSFEVLGFFEDYNQKEKDYIKEFCSLYPNGYNLLEGGEEPPVLKGEENPSTKITEKRAFQIKEALLNYEIPLKEILKTLGVTRDIVRHINEGDSWRDDSLHYPLRPLETELQKERISEVKRLLKETDMPQKEIAKKVHLKRSFVTMINIGKNHYDKLECYPIRDTYKKKAFLVKKLLMETDLSLKKIADKVEVSLRMVNNILYGKTWRDNKLKYPLR